MKLKPILIVFSVFTSLGYSQTNDIDISGLPKADAVQKDTLVDRWGSMYNAVVVHYQENDTTYQPFYIEAEISSSKDTYLIFFPGGSGNDIWLYPNHKIHTNKEALKHIVFGGSSDIKERAILISDLSPGYYPITYLSCHFGRNYLLHIKKNKTP